MPWAETGKDTSEEGVVAAGGDQDLLTGEAVDLGDPLAKDGRIWVAADQIVDSDDRADQIRRRRTSLVSRQIEIDVPKARGH